MPMPARGEQMSIHVTVGPWLLWCCYNQFLSARGVTLRGGKLSWQGGKYLLIIKFMVSALEYSRPSDPLSTKHLLPSFLVEVNGYRLKLVICHVISGHSENFSRFHCILGRKKHSRFFAIRKSNCQNG